MQNRVFTNINGTQIDVTTVMDKTINYTPSTELCESVKNGMTDVFDEYLPGLLHNGDGLDVMMDPDGKFWKAKGWLVAAMEKHPNYNGNLQIVIPEMQMIRHIDKRVINEFFTWATSYLEDEYYFIDSKGNKVNKEDKHIIREDIRHLRDLRHVAERIFYNTSNEKIRKKADNLYYEYSEKLCEVRRQHYEFENEMSALEKINDFIKVNAPDADVQFCTDELAKIINDIFEDVRFCVGGQKISRIVNKICKRTNLTKIVDIRDCSFFDQNGEFHNRTKDFGWNYKFAQLGDAINPIIQTATAVISVNPVDYLTMSIGKGWASCMTIDKDNIRRLCNTYHGMYFGGTESYMLDASTVVFYFLPKEWNGEHPEFEEKVKRCLFYLGEDKLIQSRVYPDGRDGGEESLAGDIRTIMQKVVADIFDVPNYWSNKSGTNECSSVTQSYGVHYKDYLCYGDCNVSYLKRIDGHKNLRIVAIGTNPICPECGCTHELEDNVFCPTCCDHLVCADCGRVLDEDEVRWVDGVAYCEDCVNWCECCENYVHEELTRTAEGDYVCENCLENEYVYSDYDDEYIRNENAIETEEGNYYPEYSDGYRYCYECGECHDYDELIYDEITEEYYCQDCYERLMAERAEEESEEEDIA